MSPAGIASMVLGFSILGVILYIEIKWLGRK